MAIVEVHVHSNADLTEVNQKLDQLLALAKGIKREDVMLSQEVQGLVDEVAAIKDQSASAVVAINGIVAKFNDMVQAATDLAEVKVAAAAMTQDLKDNVATPLGAAVANIPA